jgi:phosphatidylcholine synthase
MERVARRDGSRRVMQRQESSGLQIAAWAVHLFTGSGVVLALLALAAVQRGRTFEALLWLALAGLVDGVDGTFARAVHVCERLPRIDGDALDLVVDYLTYVFVPALIIWTGDYLPAAWALPLTAAILVSSLYVFARRDMKTEDGYFRGFPALWNVIAVYFFVAQPEPWLGAAIVIVLVAMTFAPVHMVHPFRVRDYGWSLPAITIVWALATTALLVPDWKEDAQTVLLTLSIAAALVLIGMGLLRTFRGPRKAQ